MDLPKRKNIRLQGYDYSKCGAYFITVCTNNRKNVFCEIVGCDAHIAPHPNVPSINLLPYGQIVLKYLNNIIGIDKYVLMPDHVHFIFFIGGKTEWASKELGSMWASKELGSMWASTPTVSTVVRSFKTMVSKECGFSIWQRNYYEHIIRDEDDYQRICMYIDENPIKWIENEIYKYSENTF